VGQTAPVGLVVFTEIMTVGCVCVGHTAQWVWSSPLTEIRTVEYGTGYIGALVTIYYITLHPSYHITSATIAPLVTAGLLKRTQRSGLNVRPVHRPNTAESSSFSVSSGISCSLLLWSVQIITVVT
jgi:hypothetical protein